MLAEEGKSDGHHPDCIWRKTTCPYKLHYRNRLCLSSRMSTKVPCAYKGSCWSITTALPSQEELLKYHRGDTALTVRLEWLECWLCYWRQVLAGASHWWCDQEQCIFLPVPLPPQCCLSLCLSFLTPLSWTAFLYHAPPHPVSALG